MNDRPFEAALFDLDGTLLDSMYVWARVDQLFFEKRGICPPADYGPALAGLSYRESAEYTIRRFGFKESWQEIVAEWTDMARREYAEHVPLKPGALEYLRWLKRAGVRLAVATALPEHLYRPCLERHGLLSWFDALCSTEETGGRGKAGGEVYLLAAARLGVRPEDCAVFEDVLEGISGAKRAGMRAYCVRDAAARHAFAKLEAAADGIVDDLREMARYHPMPDNARRCVIFTARCDGDVCSAYRPRANDLCLCADAGWKLAESAGAPIDYVIGDFDAACAPGDLPPERLVRHPVVKDDTDTLLCARFGLARGIDDFLIVGGFGGRLDHTLANLQTLSHLAQRGASCEMADGRQHAWAVHNGGLSIARRPGKLSVFALCGECTGVWIRGAKYNLEDARLTPDFPIGAGNDFMAPTVEIGVADGTLTVVCEESAERDARETR